MFHRILPLVFKLGAVPNMSLPTLEAQGTAEAVELFESETAVSSFLPRAPSRRLLEIPVDKYPKNILDNKRTYAVVISHDPESEEHKDWLWSILDVISEDPISEEQLEKFSESLMRMDWKREEQEDYVCRIFKRSINHHILYDLIPTLFTRIQEVSPDPEVRNQIVESIIKAPISDVVEVFEKGIDFFDALAILGWSAQKKLEYLEAVFIYSARGNIDFALKHTTLVINKLTKRGWSVGAIGKVLQETMKKAGKKFGFTLGDLITFLEVIDPLNLTPNDALNQYLSILGKSGKRMITDFRIIIATLQYVRRDTPKEFSRMALATIQDWLYWMYQRGLQHMIVSYGNQGYRFRKLKGCEKIMHMKLHAEILKSNPSRAQAILSYLLGSENNQLKLYFDDHDNPLNDSNLKSVIEFINKFGAFNISLYQLYNRSTGKKAFISAVEDLKEQIFNDELTSEEAATIVEINGIGYLVGVIQLVSHDSRSSFLNGHSAERHLERVIALGDNNYHLPIEWYGKKETFTLPHLERILTAEGEVSIEEGLEILLQPIQDNLIKIPKVGNFHASLVGYILDPDDEGKRQVCINELYRVALHDPALLPRIRALLTENSYTQLSEFLELYTDNDALPRIVREVMQKLDPRFFIDRGFKRDITDKMLPGLLKTIRGIWSQHSQAPSKRTAALAKIAASFSESDIESKILTADIPEGAKATIRKHKSDRLNLRVRDVIKNLFAKPTRQARALQAQFEVKVVSERKIGLSAVQGVAYGLWGVTAGVCIANNLSLWTDPKFKLLAITDEDEQTVVGYVMGYEVEDDGNKVLALVGIEPSAEFMDTIDAHDFYNKLMDKVKIFAKAAGYKGVYIPTQKTIHSNRPKIQTVIADQGYEVVTFDPPVDWIEKYTFGEVFVLWEDL